jgi:cation diffusion facilitator CzcD-associated flavoprotein CzcO
MHSKEYKRPDVLANQRVLVIGGGNSACDIAVEAARVGLSSHISLRRGYWFMPKTMLGVPTVELMRPWLPGPAQRAFVRTMVRLVVGRYERYGLQHPDHAPFEHHPTINSELLHQIRHGRITPHPDIARFDGKDAVFVDGTRETFDLVVAATGYHVSLPFLDDGIVAFKNGIPQLVAGVLAPGFKNLYVFGTGQPRYGAGPLITEGARVLCAMIDAERELAGPLADVFVRLGARPPTSHLQDPHAALRQMRVARRVIPWLPRFAGARRAA